MKLFVFAVISSIVLAASCANLPNVDANVCGNKVVDTNEDCDSFGVGGTTFCRAATSAQGACRFDCDSSKQHTCPDSYGCGADNICRLPSGTFGKATPVGVPVEQMAIGDFDGDRHQDVVTQAASGLRVHFFDHGATADSIALSQVTSLPVTRGRVVAGSLTADGLASITVVDTAVELTTDYVTGKSVERVLGGGVNVWRARSDRSLLPTIYPSFPLGSIAKEAMVLPALATNFHPGQDLFIIIDRPYKGKPYVLAYNDVSAATGGLPLSVLPLASGPTSFVGRPPIAPLAIAPVGELCDSIVIAPKGATDIILEPLCKPTSSQTNPNLLLPNVEDVPAFPGAPWQPTTLPLPPKATVGGRAFVKDVNRDGHFDVVITGSNDGVGIPLYVAYAIGDGNFSSMDKPLVSDNKFGVYPFYDGAKKVVDGPLVAPLDIGFVDDDSVLDWVDPQRIRFGAADRVPFSIASSSPTGWTEARILDTNANGLQDVVAISSGGLDFYNGTGSFLMNHVPRAFDGTPTHLVIADVDGDLAYDLCVSVSGDSQSLLDATPSDVFWVEYGTGGGLPSAPTFAGRVPPISEMEPALLSWVGGRPDYVSSIAALTKINGQLYALAIQGSTSRELTAPFTLATSSMPPTRGAAFDAVVGNFLPVGDPSGRTALVAIAIDTAPDAPKPPLYKGQLWAAPVSGDAQFDAQKLVPLPAQAAVAIDPLQLNGGRVVALDLDPPGAGGVDEALILIPAYKRKDVVTPGVFVITALDTANTARSWSGRSAPVTFEGQASTRTFPLSVSIGDIDGDGAKDVLVFALSEKAPFAKVMFNNQTGSLDYTKAVSVTLPPNAVAATTIHATPDSRAQVAVLTLDGVVIIPTAPDSPRAFAPPGSCTPPVFISCAVPFAHEQAGSLLDVRAADVDGDGVEDVIVAGPSGFKLFRGAAVRP